MGDPLVESFRFIDRSWAEIRESFRTGEPYSQIYERLFPQIVNVVYPGSIIDLPETRQAVQAQVERATPQGILSELGMGTRITTEIGKQVAIEDIQGNSFSLELKDQYKLFVFGAQEPKMETGDTLTRLYIALDPRKATDGFIS
ncbi:MAG: hypothetical protein Q7S76_03885, partial [bacterium]|nr:hypothetical protein [bacterium]